MIYFYIWRLEIFINNLKMDISDYKKLISHNKLEECLIQLCDHLKEKDRILLNDTVSILARYNNLNSQMNSGVIESNDFSTEFSRLVISTISVIDKIELIENKKSNQNKDLTEIKFEHPIERGYPDLSKEFENATQVSLLGSVLSTTVSRYNSKIIKLLEKGNYLRFIISEPITEVFHMQKFRSSLIKDDKFMMNASYNTISSILEFSKRAKKGGMVNLKTIPYLNPYTIIHFKNSDELSKVYVRLNSFQINGSEQPVLVYDEKNNENWYRFFVEEFENIWEVGDEINYSNYEEKYKFWDQRIENKSLKVKSFYTRQEFDSYIKDKLEKASKLRHIHFSTFAANTIKDSQRGLYKSIDNFISNPKNEYYKIIASHKDEKFLKFIEEEIKEYGDKKYQINQLNQVFIEDFKLIVILIIDDQEVCLGHASTNSRPANKRISITGKEIVDFFIEYFQILLNNSTPL